MIHQCRVLERARQQVQELVQRDLQAREVRSGRCNLLVRCQVYLNVFHEARIHLHDSCVCDGAVPLALVIVVVLCTFRGSLCRGFPCRCRGPCRCVVPPRRRLLSAASVPPPLRCLAPITVTRAIIGRLRARDTQRAVIQLKFSGDWCRLSTHPPYLPQVCPIYRPLHLCCPDVEASQRLKTRLSYSCHMRNLDSMMQLSLRCKSRLRG